MNYSQIAKSNFHYRQKYAGIVKRIKSLLLENAALCDEVARIQESILIIKDERKFLLRKLIEYENDLQVSMLHYKKESLNCNGVGSKTKKKRNMEETSKNVQSPLN